MPISIRILIMLPVTISGIFMVLWIVLQVLYRFFNVTTELTTLANKEIMLPIIFLFVGAMLTLVLFILIQRTMNEGDQITMARTSPIPENHKLTNPVLTKEGKLSKAMSSTRVLPGWKK